ncbi:MAG: hypothetical protein ABI480_08240 [Chitinophagaceae bacterium]
MKSYIKRSTITFKALLIICFFITGLASNATAQERVKCKAIVGNIWFVEDGNSVLDVHPGDRGYQINMQGTGVNNFEIVKEPCMSGLSVIPGYTNSTAAKWQVNFSPNMERVICSIKMKNKCTGEIKTYELFSGVRLFNQ